MKLKTREFLNKRIDHYRQLMGELVGVNSRNDRRDVYRAVIEELIDVFYFVEGLACEDE